MKNKPLLNESTVRKFMKLANLGRVGEGFLAENFNEENLEEGEELEEGEDLEEGKAKGGNTYNAFKGMKKQEYKPAKGSKKVMKEADEEEEEADVDMPPADADAGAESPDMGAAPDMEPAEEPTEMDASDLADKIINVLKDAGLVDVVEDDESGVELDKEPEGEEEDDEGMPAEEEDENSYEDEGSYEEESIYESKKRQLAKLVAERVQARLAREARIESLAESITKRVMARAKATR